jgi:heat shock protein HslJ
MIRGLLALLSLVLLAISVAGCGGSSAPPPTTVTVDELRSQSWQVETIGHETAPVAGTTMTMSFAGDGTVSGKAGCNTFNGSYEATGGALTFGPMATTRMGCEQAVMDQETAFLGAVAATKSGTVTGSRLTLRDGNGATTLVLERTA